MQVLLGSFLANFGFLQLNQGLGEACGCQLPEVAVGHVNIVCGNDENQLSQSGPCYKWSGLLLLW